MAVERASSRSNLVPSEMSGSANWAFNFIASERNQRKRKSNNPSTTTTTILIGLAASFSVNVGVGGSASATMATVSTVETMVSVTKLSGLAVWAEPFHVPKQSNRTNRYFVKRRTGSEDGGFGGVPRQGKIPVL